MSKEGIMTTILATGLADDLMKDELLTLRRAEQLVYEAFKDE